MTKRTTTCQWCGTRVPVAQRRLVEPLLRTLGAPRRKISTDTWGNEITLLCAKDFIVYADYLNRELSRCE